MIQSLDLSSLCVLLPKDTGPGTPTALLRGWHIVGVRTRADPEWRASQGRGSFRPPSVPVDREGAPPTLTVPRTCCPGILVTGTPHDHPEVHSQNRCSF